jgi:hypothetical protein
MRDFAATAEDDDNACGVSKLHPLLQPPLPLELQLQGDVAGRRNATTIAIC